MFQNPIIISEFQANIQKPIAELFPMEFSFLIALVIFGSIRLLALVENYISSVDTELNTF